MHTLNSTPQPCKNDKHSFNFLYQSFLLMKSLLHLLNVGNYQALTVKPMGTIKPPLFKPVEIIKPQLLDSYVLCIFAWWWQWPTLPRVQQHKCLDS